MKKEIIPYHCLIEALRRFESFGKDQGGKQKKWTIKNLVQHNWTGLGYPSSYKKAVQTGYFTGMQTPKILNWHNLTEKGAKIVLKWHNEGYHYDENKGIKNIPFNTNFGN